MSHRTGIQRRTWKERALSLLLAAVMLAGLLPGMTLPSAAEHWADTYLDQLVDWGVLRADQTADPDAALTRAEFMAIINRAYGYTETGPIPFEDVKTTDWFYDDVAIAYNAGYMAGTSDITASPHDTLTREQAVCILGRNMMMKDTAGESLAFADSRDVSDWARGTVKTAVDNYIISGYPDNTFHPKAAISKAQMAVLITQCVGSPIQQSGSYEMGGVFGNVTITSPNVTLRNTTISGDLYVSGGVGLGGIRLENVNVLGRIILSGTGESEAGDASVVMRNVTAQEMLVDNMRNKTVTIRADGITDIGKTTVRTNAYLEDNNTDDKGLMNIELDGESGTNLTLAGRIKKVVDKTPNSYIQVAKGTVDTLTVDEAAVNSTVQLDRNTEVKTMNLDVATNVTGDGDIGELNVNAPGCVVAMLPDKIYIRPGLTANIAGVVMDHQAAEEGSLDPRLLSGYPAAKDITPTGLRADFSGNKKGTVYWAVSSITDGSIGEEDLISPPSYGSKAIRNGSVAAPTGGSEVSAQVTGLTVGGSYYLSAMLVDDQGNRSPVKVVSFSTPDNTVPAFGQGYPYMSFIGKANENDDKVTAQVAVMATKTCRMYYAVLPAGAAAPTIDELRSASVSSNLGYGVVELEKNYVWDGDRAIIVSRRLEEQKNYVLYLWLTDGVNNSAVTNLAFTTPDVTPPKFVSDPKVNGEAQTNSVPMTATVDENSTIFWVAVESGADYPYPNPNNKKENTEDGKTALLDSEYAKLQVANGMNSVSRGSVTATGNTPVNFNITGLQAEMSYDVYFVIRDTAGNYSRSVYKVPGGIRTLDTGAPTVRQFFTKVDPQDATRPMRDTDIVLEFSENVRFGGSNGKDLLALYEATQNGTTSEREAALEEFVTTLRNNIEFNVRKNGRPYSAVRGKTGVSEDDWVIDFSKATVANVSGKVQITFHNKVGDDQGLRLDSGATYFFEVNTNSTNKITDLSGHAIETSPVRYDTPESEGHSVPLFVVVFARVDMTSDEFRLSDAHWPEAIKAENEDNAAHNKNIGNYKVDFKFRLMPEDTESVAEGIAYDLLLWTDTDIEYDLYYRAVTGEPGEEVAITAQRDENGFIYGMPNMSAAPDKNGWVKLGNSGTYIFGAQSEGRPGKRMHFTFNGCTSTQGDGLPDLKRLASRTPDGEEIYYDFAVSVRKMNGLDDPNSWGDTVSFYVDVAAGYPSSLSDLSGIALTPAKWQEFRNNGLNSGGGESVGSADKYKDDPRQLYMQKAFEDSVQPSFTDNSPTFTHNPNDETKVSINLALTRSGRVYYVVGYGDKYIDRPEPVNEDAWESSVITRKTDGTAIKPYMVPSSGAERVNEDPGLPELDPDWPLATRIQYPSGSWAQTNGVVTYGNEYYTQGTYLDIPLEDLKANRTYYVYFVITGSSEVPSEVEIYKFKTDPVSRPVIDISSTRPNNTGNGRVTLGIKDKDAALTYKVYTKTSTSSISWLSWRLDSSSVLNSAYTTSMLPQPYANMTVYDALMTKYSYDRASVNGTVTNGKYFPTTGSGNPESFTKEYSVFDIYASDNMKATVRDWLYADEGLSPADKNTRDEFVRAGGTKNGNLSLNPNLTYYAIAMARQEPEDEEAQQNSVGLRYSFMGGEIKIGDQDPPNLIRDSVNGYFDIENDGTFAVGGFISFDFDKEVHYRGTRLDQLTSFSSAFNSTVGINLAAGSGSSVSITADNYTTIYLALDANANRVSVSTGASQWTNSYGAGGGYSLSIRPKTGAWPEAQLVNNRPRYVLEVSWGGVTREIEGYGPVQPATTTASLQSANATFSTTSTGKVASNGEVRMSFDNPLYLGEDQPVTSVKQLLGAAQEVKGIEENSGTVRTTEQGTQVTLKLKKDAQDVSLKINGGTLTNSSGVAAEETLTVKMDKRVEASQSNIQANRHYMDISWGDKTWTSVEKK